jgi:large subunit ribosomal protein L23
MQNSQTSTTDITQWKELFQSHFSPVNMMSDFIKYPVTTEKSYLSMFQNKQYTFDVDSRLTKPQIRKLFETLFSVNVIALNTHTLPRKKIRTGFSAGYRPRYKRVILTLKEGQTLQF